MITLNTLSFNNFKSSVSPAIKNNQKPNNKVSIYYYNDTHGNSDQMAGLINSAKQFKKQNANNPHFILSAGDNVSGGDTQKNRFIGHLMENIMGVQVSAIGNHEMDAAAKGFFDVAKTEKTQYVASNVDFDDEHPMDEVVKKSIIKEQNGIKYGFIGAMPIDFKTCTKAEVQKGIEIANFEESVEEIQEEIDNLKSQGVNRIILLSHSGYDTDKQYAQNLSGVDIIIGGHSHTKLEGAKQGENLVYSKTGEPVIITQAGENGKFYGILNVEFNNNGILTKIENQLLESNHKLKNPVIEYIKDSDLGKSPKVGVLSEVDPLPPNRRIEPCAWTSVMADSMKTELNADISLINSANIRKVPQVGVLTERDITESAPMKNNLIKTKLTQKQLVEAVKNAAKKTMTASNGEPGLLQGSGFTYKINEQGDLLEMNIISQDGTKTPIDINNPSEQITYSAIYDTFTCKADGETPELAPKFEVEEFNFDKDKTMIDYLSKREDKEKLVIKYDDRIQILKTSQPQQPSNRNRMFLNLTAPKAS